ncbi:alpha-tocopherol transfer protein-like [Ptychodera flava]|uniref:alpha-tocopherol transfer protein-like n=1 Tax=Ptychodera flava TaxID=63121 RepID=UPI00396A0104
MTENSTLPYKCTMSEATLEKAKREVNEDPGTRQQKLNELRDLFKTRPDINFRLDDAFLLRFLRNKKFDVDRAFKMLIHYYKVRKDFPDMFDNYVPSSVKKIFELNTQMVCPGTDKEGRVILVGKIGDWDPEKYALMDGIKAQLLLLETLLADEEVQVHGMVFVADYAGLNKKHMKFMSPMVMKKMNDVYMNAMPIRFKAMHYVRQPELFSTLFALFKPLLTEKMKKRLNFHGDEYGTLHEHVPSALLPTELGGQLPGYDNSVWMEKVLAAEEEFVYNNQFGFLKSDDILGKEGSSVDPTTGLTGTFKKLDVI